MPANCVARTTKKYTNRPSPPYPANDCPGKTKKGNDGRKYKSIANKNGVYSWKVVKTLATKSRPRSRRRSRSRRSRRRSRSRKSRRRSSSKSSSKYLFDESPQTHDKVLSDKISLFREKERKNEGSYDPKKNFIWGNTFDGGGADGFVEYLNSINEAETFRKRGKKYLEKLLLSNSKKYYFVLDGRRYFKQGKDGVSHPDLNFDFYRLYEKLLSHRETEKALALKKGTYYDVNTPPDVWGGGVNSTDSISYFVEYLQKLGKPEVNKFLTLSRQKLEKIILKNPQKYYSDTENRYFQY